MRAQDVRVLAILVATNGEEWLPDCIRGLQAQTHHALDVIAVDNACTDASGRMLEKAFGGNAIVLDRRVGYGRACAAALKVAGERGADPDAFLLVHDDVAIEPEAVEHLVETMLADESVGVVGGKLLEWDDPSMLQEVGMSTDRYGRLFPKLERGELDHGQHDGRREVLFCTSAALLVRRSVVEAVGFFDPRYVAMRDDLDLCWRARIAGFRTIVTTDARARHVSAATRGKRIGPISEAGRYFSERNRIATLLKNYSTARLALVLPVLVLQSIVGALLYFARGRRSIARQILGALQWNLVHVPSTLRARARARRHRRAPDADVLKLMVRGAPRLRGYVERVLETVVGEPIEGIEEAELGARDETTPRRRLGAFLAAHPAGSAFAILLVVYLVGVRSLLGSGELAGAGLLPFPSTTVSFFREFGSGWRTAGAAGAHPPGLAMLLLGALSFLSFGSVWLASRVLVLALVPVAAAMAHRAAGRLGIGPAGRFAAALVYGLSPLALIALGHGRLPELVLLAAAPGLLLPLLGGSGVADEGAGDTRPVWRSTAAGTAGLAIAGAFSPYALPFVVAAALVVAIVSRWTGGRPLVVVRSGALMAAGAFALLFPWSLELIRPGSPLGEGGLEGPVKMLDVARLAPHGSPLGPLAWAFLAVALLGLALSASRRPRLAVVLAALATASIAAAWGTGRTTALGPRAALPLTGAAFAFAVLVGMAAEAAGPALRERSFGMRHIAVGASAAFIGVAVALSTGWIARGSFPELGPARGLLPAFVPADAQSVGEFRVLWVGPPLRGGPTPARIDLTGPSGETMLSYGVRRSGAADSYLVRAASALIGGQTDQGGHLLAPLGVRHVLVRPGTPAALVGALERQTDLRFRLTFGGARVYDNLAWLPVAAPLADGNEWIAALRSDDPFSGAVGVDVASDPTPGLRRDRPARFSGTLPIGTRAVVLGEAFDGKWRLIAGGRAIAPRRAFGFATAFDVPQSVSPPAPKASPTPTPTPTRRARGPRAASPSPSPSASPPARAVRGPDVRIVWRGQSATRFLLLIQLGAWIVFLAWWSGRRALERGER